MGQQLCMLETYFVTLVFSCLRFHAVMAPKVSFLITSIKEKVPSYGFMR